MDTDQLPLPTQQRMALPRSTSALLSRVWGPPIDGGGDDEFGSYALTTNDIPVALFALYVCHSKMILNSRPRKFSSLGNQ
jgi:hypothetical protein